MDLKELSAFGGAAIILAAIITSAGDIIGGIGEQWYINYYTEGSASPDIEINYVESKLRGPNLDDQNGRHAIPPYIDIILSNRGKSTGIITRLDLEITNAFLNATPVLSFCNFIAVDPNTIQAKIINEGWGPAKELEWRSNITLGEFTSKLNIPNDQFNWTGDVGAGEALNLNFIYQLEEGFVVSFLNTSEIYDHDGIYKQISKGKIFTEINYKDMNMKRYLNHIEKSIFLYKFDRFEYPSGSFSFSDGAQKALAEEIGLILNPLEIFYIDSIDPETKCPYKISFDVAHVVGEGQVDRIVLKINSTEKSGKIEYKVKVIYNSKAPAISEVRYFEWININRNYLKNIKYIDVFV